MQICASAKLSFPSDVCVNKLGFKNTCLNSIGFDWVWLFLLILWFYGFEILINALESAGMWWFVKIRNWFQVDVLFLDFAPMIAFSSEPGASEQSQKIHQRFHTESFTF